MIPNVEGLALIAWGLALLVAWFLWATDPHRYPEQTAPPVDDDGGEL